MRIILYTGKGGVGKTSIAAATACKIAGMGKKVLIMSTDQAHSLGDSFNKKLDNNPKMICKNLYAMEIDAVLESENAWGNLKDYFKKLLTIQTNETIEIEEMLVFPGFEELFSLFKILEVNDAGDYDVLIVDCAPTGETMSLLKYPEMFGDIISKFLPVEKKMVKVAGPLVEKTTKIPMPEENVFDEIEHLCQKMYRLREILSQNKDASIRIVTTPEKIVVKESKRNFTYLHLYDYKVDAIIVNKIYPQPSLEGYFDKWIEKQENSLKDIEESFGDIPVFHMYLLKNELRTLGRLQDAAEKIYKGKNPMDVFFKDTVFTLEKMGNQYNLYIILPFTDKKDLDLIQKGNELSLSVQNQHRNFILPDKLNGYSVKAAKYEDGRLKIQFSDTP